MLAENCVFPVLIAATLDTHIDNIVIELDQ